MKIAAATTTNTSNNSMPKQRTTLVEWVALKRASE